MHNIARDLVRVFRDKRDAAARCKSRERERRLRVDARKRDEEKSFDLSRLRCACMCDEDEGVEERRRLLRLKPLGTPLATTCQRVVCQRAMHLHNCRARRIIMRVSIG